MSSRAVGRSRIAAGHAFAVALVIGAAIPVARAQTGPAPFSIDFVWGDVRLCSPVEEQSPPIFLSNMPPRTAKVLMALTVAGSGREVASAMVPGRKSGTYPSGEFRMRTPCDSGDYTWTATAQDTRGVVLGTASQTKPLP